MSMMGLFIPIFMYHSGYDLTSIMLLFVFFFLTRGFADIASGFLVARFGPKHIILAGQTMTIISAISFLTLNMFGWPLFVLGAVWGISQSLFIVALDTDFSKVKHPAHSGKELGYLIMMTKIGSLLGPVVGGLVGYLIGGQYIFILASITMLLGLIPLFKTKEPLHTHQKLDLNKLPVKKVKSVLLPMFGAHLDNSLSLMIWPLFLAVIVIPGDKAFLNVGLITSISLAASILGARFVGRQADSSKGRQVLRTSAISNAALHWLRPFVGSYAPALALNIANDLAIIGMRLPFLKGYFIEADSTAEQRILFISLTESFASFLKMFAYCILAVASVFVSEHNLFNLSFLFAGLASLLVMTEKLKSLNPNWKAGNK